MAKISWGKLPEKAQRLRRFWAWSTVAKQLESYSCIYRSTGSLKGGVPLARGWRSNAQRPSSPKGKGVKGLGVRPWKGSAARPIWTAECWRVQICPRRDSLCSTQPRALSCGDVDLVWPGVLFLQSKPESFACGSLDLHTLEKNSDFLFFSMFESFVFPFFKLFVSV